MSLKAWYPLNGNLKNYGTNLHDLTVYNNTAAPFGSGKVTKQGYNGGTSYLKAPYDNTQSNAITFALWVKPTSPNLWADIFSFGNGSNRIEISADTGRYTWYVSDNNYSLFSSGTNLFTIPNQEWHHITIAADGTNVYVYLDGDLKLTQTQLHSVATCFGTQKEIRIGCRNTDGGCYYGGIINDFRVYDHCLTPREVKQVAQGLAWHWKLNSVANPNLISDVVARKNIVRLNNYSLDLDLTPRNDTYFDLKVSPALELNKTYTLSFDVSNYPEAVGGYGLYMFAQNNSNYYFEIRRNGHYKFTFQTDPAKLPSGYNLSQFIVDDGGHPDVDAVIRLSNFKIELGNAATKWCPNVNDTQLYPIFSANNTTEYDCSGYGHHGTRNGSLKGSEDTPRYTQSTEFAYGDYIRNTTMDTTGWNDLTVAAWVNPSTYTATGADTGRQTIMIGGVYLTLANGIVSTYCYGKTSDYYNGVTKVPLNTWSHIAVTYDTVGNLKIYVNGNLDKTYTGVSGICDGSSLHEQKEIGAETNGASRRFQGKISDVRIYATALSDKAIQELSQVATTYHNNGVYETYTIVTDSVNNIKNYRNKTSAEDFSEIGYIGGMKTKVLSDGSAWARIHWLDVTTENTYFTDANEVAFCDKPNRFSRMGLVDYFKSKPLPKDYVQLEYIESTGSQYINTNWFWRNETVKVYMDATVTSNSGYQSLFGNEEPYSGGDRYFGIIPHGSNGSYGIYTGISSVANINPGIGNRFTLECSTNTSKQLSIKVNGGAATTASYSGTVMSYNHSTTGSANKGEIFIFSNHNSSSGAAPTQNIGGMKLYAFKMYDNNQIVRDFIPCRRADGTIGLYDKIYRRFYTSPNGVAFLGGNPITSNEDGVYEFMLTHPRISTTGYNRWTQASSPNESTSIGVNISKNTWSQANAGIRKHGGACIYNCDSGSSWYAPIGQTSQWTTGKYIPAADESSTTEIELWVRIDNLPKLNKMSMLNDKSIQAFEINEL